MAEALPAVRTALLIGSLISAFSAKQQDTGPRQIANVSIQTTMEGTPVTLLYGTKRVSGNCIWFSGYTARQQSSGKGGKGGGGKGGPTQTTYTASFAVGICCGPIRRVLRVWADDQIILDFTGNLSAQNPDTPLTSGQYTFYYGTATQPQDPTILAAKNAAIASPPVLSESFLANSLSPSYTVKQPPVTDTSWVVQVPTTSETDRGTIQGFWTLTRAGSAPGVNQYTVDDTTGLVTLGSGYNAGAGEVDYATTATLVIVNYTPVGASNVASTTTPRYPYLAYMVANQINVGAAQRIPNYLFEVQRVPDVGVAPSILGQGNFNYTNLLGDLWVADDGVNFVYAASPPNFGGSVVWHVVNYWASENDLNTSGRIKTQIALSSQGIFFTTDGGLTWTKTPTNPPVTGGDLSRSILPCILPDGTLLIADGNYPPRVFRSTDGGATWASPVVLPNAQGDPACGYGQLGCQLFGTFQRDSKGALYLCGTNPGNYASCGLRQAIIWRSVDGGVTWTSVLNYTDTATGLYSPNPMKAALSYKYTQAYGDVLLFAWSASNGNGEWIDMWRSTDGVTWTGVTGFDPYVGQELAISGTSTIPIQGYRNNPAWMANGDWIILTFSTAGGDATPHLWRSRDGGVTFVSDDASLPLSGPVTGTLSMVGWGETGRSVAEPIVVCGTAGGGTPRSWLASSTGRLWNSTDGGRTWTAYAAGPVVPMGSFFSPNADLQQTTTSLDMNPACIIEDLCTVARYAGSLPDVAINRASFTAAHDYYDLNDLLLSPHYTNRQAILQHLNDLLIIIDSYLIVSQGGIKLLPRGLAVPIYDISLKNYTNEQEPTVARIGPADITSRVIIHWVNRYGTDPFAAAGTGQLQQGEGSGGRTFYTPSTDMAYEDWLIEDNEGTELDVGGEAICTPTRAQKIGHRILWTRAFNRFNMKIPVGPQDPLLEPGDVIRLTDAGLSMSGKTFRIISVDEDQTGRQLWSVIEENTQILGWNIASIATQRGANPFVTPAGTPGTLLTAQELPPPAVNGNGSILLAAASRSPSWFGANIYVSNDNATYTPLIKTTVGAVVGYLAQPLGADYHAIDDSSILEVTLLTPGATLSTVTDAQWRAGTNKLLVGNEIIYFQNATLVSGSTWALSMLMRGMEGTIADPHSANEYVLMAPTGLLLVTPTSLTTFLTGMQPLDGVPLVLPLIGQTLYFKAATLFRDGSEQSLADVPAISLVYTGVGGLPMKVEDVRANNTVGGVVRAYSPQDGDVAVDVTPNRDLTVIWNYQSVTFQEDQDFVYGTQPAHDSTFDHYVITVTVGGVVVRTDTSSTESYTYTEAHNIADNGSWQSVVTVGIQAQRQNGDRSPIVSKVFQMVHV